MATVVTLAAPPDSSGVFTGGNLTCLQNLVTNQNTNNSNLNAAIAAIVAGGFNATDSITAHAGGGQASATALTTVVNRVTTVATAADSVKLPLATAGAFCVIVNDTATSLQAFGAGTDTIDDVATATGVPVTGNSMAIFLCPTAAPAGKWYSLGQWNVQFSNILFSALLDSNGNPVLASSATASAVNGLTVTNAAASSAPIIASSGSDTNIGLTLNSKGTGAIAVAPGTAAGTITVGGSAQSGTITVGSSSVAETVGIAAGAGAPTVQVANTSTAGATVSVATAATAGSATDTVNIATGNAASTAAKKVNLLTGTPNTSGNNQFFCGGGATTLASFNAVVTSYQAINYQGTEGGANNALTCNLVDAAGANITLAAGLRLTLLIAHTLQAGANTLALNGGATKSIKSHRNTANNIGTAYSSGSIIELIYDGTQWQDLSQ